ncbi:NleF caspase inhibitor [Yersinia wautersii]|uniref:NleF caspase inhibitor n=1 Tax=Yersinia wautersii TaxID=1341643 RepID=UPI000410A0A5|nr:NleF caspase inhibitor [Yersinia wautersii]
MGLSLSCIKTVDDYVKHLDCNRVSPSKTLGDLKIDKSIINAETQHTIDEVKQKLTLIKERYDASMTDEFKLVKDILTDKVIYINQRKDELYEPEDYSLSGVQERELKKGKTAQDRDNLVRDMVALYQIKNAIKEMVPEDKTKTIDDYRTYYPQPTHNGKVLDTHHPLYSLVEENIKHKSFSDLYAIENNGKVPHVIYSNEWDEVDG